MNETFTLLRGFSAPALWPSSQEQAPGLSELNISKRGLRYVGTPMGIESEQSG